MSLQLIHVCIVRRCFISNVLPEAFEYVIVKSLFYNSILNICHCKLDLSLYENLKCNWCISLDIDWSLTIWFWTSLKIFYSKANVLTVNWKFLYVDLFVPLFGYFEFIIVIIWWYGILDAKYNTVSTYVNTYFLYRYQTLG